MRPILVLALTVASARASQAQKTLPSGEPGIPGKILVSGFDSDALHGFRARDGALRGVIGGIPGAQCIVRGSDQWLYVCAEKVDRVVRIVWILAAVLAGLAGVLWAYYRPGIKWDMGAQILLLMFAAVTLGGLGTALGALVGSLVVGILVEVSSLWIPADLKYVGALVLLIVILLFRPQGILGRRERIG